jgi:hypothetical protein
MCWFRLISAFQPAGRKLPAKSGAGAPHTTSPVAKEALSKISQFMECGAPAPLSSVFVVGNDKRLIGGNRLTQQVPARTKEAVRNSQGFFEAR